MTAPAPAPRPARERFDPALRLVPPQRRRRAPRLPFVLLVTALLGAGLMALLVLNTLAAQDAFRLHHLRERTDALADQQQALTLQVARDRAPATLAERAKALGMVPAGQPGYVTLPDGRVVGSAKAASPPPSPAPSATAPAAGTRPHPAPSAAAPAAGTRPHPAPSAAAPAKSGAARR